MFYLDYMLKNYLSGVPVIYLAGAPKFSSTQFHFPLFEGNILKPMLKYSICWYQTCYKENLFWLSVMSSTTKEMKKIKQYQG